MTNPNSTPVSVPAATGQIDKLKDMHAKLIENIKKAQEDQAKYYDRNRKDIGSSEETPLFKVGDQVFLNAKNIPSLRPSAKLDQKFLGPFTIIGNTPSPLSFKLDLPTSMNIHPVFHVTCLEPVRPSHEAQTQETPLPVIVDGEEEWFVDDILDSRYNEDTETCEYLVKWRGFSSEHNSWEPWEAVKLTTSFAKFRRKNRNSNHYFPANTLTRRTNKTTRKPRQQN